MLSTIWTRRLQYAFIAIVTISVGFSLYQWNASRASTNKTAPNNGLVGYWSMNEGTGTSAGDASGNNNTGTLTNGPTWVSGRLGQAVNFDGVNDYITMGDQSSLEINNNSLSFGGWFYINAYPAANNRMFLITKGTTGSYEYELTVSGYATNHLTGTVFNTAGGNYVTATSTTVPPLNTWFHVMAVWDKDAPSDAVKLYYNGVLDGVSGAPNGTVIHTTRTANFEIGRRGDNAEKTLNGMADEVRVYNRALSAAEVMTVYNLNATRLNTSENSSLTSGLVGLWSFNGTDISGTTAYDRSGSANNGTLTNGPTTTIGKLGQALNFDGVDDYVTTTNTTSLDNLFSSAVTFCAWAKFPNFTSYNRLITIENNAGTDYDVWIQTQQSSAIVQFGAGGTGKFKTSTTALSANTWYHLCGVTDYTAGGTKIFINGVEDAGSLGGTPTYTADKGYLDIGRLRATSSSLYGTGQIDEVRVYNRALSTTEIQSLYDLGASDKVNSSVSQNQGTGRLDSGLAGYWKLDDASGTTATDSSTNANNGTLTNGPTWGTGKIGSDVVFDGVNDYIISGSNISLANRTFSVAAWAKRTSNNTWDFIITQGSSAVLNQAFQFGFRDNNTFTCSFYANDLDTVATYTDSTWHYWVCSYDVSNSSRKIYRDGVLVASNSAAAYVGSGQLNIGRYQVLDTYFHGSIDEVRVYNRALSDDEVSQLYRLTAPTGVDTSLKGYWSFNGPDISGTTAYDRSGNANNGTLTNGPTATIGKSGQALSFDGVNDCVSIPHSSVLNFAYNQDFSVSAWVKAPATQLDPGFGGNIILQKWANTGGYPYAIRIFNQTYGVSGDRGKVYALRYDATNLPTLVSGVKINDDTWHHISFTKNGSTLSLYIDGNSSVTTTTDTTTGTTTNSYPLYIGGEQCSVYPFNGKVDEVRVYNRALSATEITALYNSGR